MIIETKLSKEDYIRSSIEYMFRKRTEFAMLVGAALLFLPFYVSSLIRGYTVPIIGYGFVYGSTILVVIIVFIVLVSAARKVNFLSIPTHLEISQDKITSGNETDSVTFNWFSIVQWIKVKNYYLVHFSAVKFIIVQSEDVPDKEAFEKLLTEKIGEHK